MKERLKDVGPLLVLGLAGTIFIAWLVLRGGLGGPSPLSAVPEDSFLAITLDVRAFAESPLAEAFVGKRGGAGETSSGARVLGLDAMTEACGFNPLTRLRAIAVAVPEGGEGGDFGVVGSGSMTREELAKCAEAMIARRGGQAKVSTVGAFTVVEDARASAGEAGPPKVAFRDGGPYLVGRGAWLARMMETAEGRVPSIERAPAHASLRSALDARDPSAHALVLTAILPKSLRDRLKSEMSDEAKEGAQSGNAAMAGVLGVASAGLALRAGAPGADAWIYAELRCESSDACDEVQKLLAKKRFAWSRDFGLRLVGLGPLIDSLEMHPDPAHPSSLLVSAHAPAEALSSAIDRALSQRRPRPSPTSATPSHLPSSPFAPGSSTPQAPMLHAPDEVIKPGKDATAPAPSDASATRR